MAKAKAKSKVKGAGKPPARKHTSTKKPKKTASTATAPETNGAGHPGEPDAHEVDQKLADLCNEHVGKIMPLISSKKNADARLKKAFELAEKAGVSRKDIKIAIQLETDEKAEDKIRDEIRNTLKVARWMRTALGSQMELFAPETAAPPADRHYQAGRAAAMRDEPRKPPDMLTQHDAQDWMRGFDDGRQALNTERATNGFMPLASAVADVVGDAITDVVDEAMTAPIGSEPATYTEATH